MNLPLCNLHPYALALCSVALSILVTSGCSKNEEPEAAAAPRLVKTIVVAAPETSGVRRFPARIDALYKAELAFRVPGTVQELPVKEGDRVVAGQLLVALDPTDYAIVANDARATFDRAKNDFERARELIKDGFISRSDFDAKEAEFKNAQAALDRAEQDLAYTRLTASFDGVVAARYVERFEEVQAKEPVLALHDNRLLEVKVDIPENVIMRLRPRGDDGTQGRNRVPVTASFDTRPGSELELTLREIATRADPKTQTFEATFTTPAPEDFLVFPGMTATVTADLSKAAITDPVVSIPATAVTADEGLDPFVWVVDEEAMRVHRNPVEVGRLSGWSIEVTEGLAPGTRVVTAGVGYLADGMPVRLLPQREEAERRPSEAPSELPAVAPVAAES